MSCHQGREDVVGVQGPIPMQHAAPSRHGRRKHFSHRIAAGLGISQVILGGILIMFGIVSVVIKTQLFFIGAPYWCGTLFSVTGAVSCVSAYKKTTQTIIASLVLSILSSVVSGIVLLVLASIALSLEDYYNDCYDYLHGRGSYICTMETIKGRLAVDGAIVVIAFLESIFGILSAVFCCRAVCCGDPGAPVVYFFAQPDAAQSQLPMATVTEGAPAVVMIPQGVQLISQGRGMPTPTGTPTHRLVTIQPTLADIPPPTGQSPPPSYASGSDQSPSSPSVRRTGDIMKAPLLSET
ncbi:uncharacterized protein LOC100374235 [Saccoglossus kowalevskii]|uniref:Membrane-spanning 4-domains subfamily A member 15-like n=1 Tax=Saccoglossus kowalevskii TaxID=10224 RepID=A0ABM0GSP6_SACKO|nr:PREDICTED: membrane-spanning 4-domains subfamily A member 15-like [Saccoglossus kowalevskii]